MTQHDFAELISDERFSPFIVTTHGGFVIAIGERERKHIVAGRNLFVTLDSTDGLIHIPYKSIATIHEPK
jgi:hypothetical protein